MVITNDVVNIIGGREANVNRKTENILILKINKQKEIWITIEQFDGELLAYRESDAALPENAVTVTQRSTNRFSPVRLSVVYVSSIRS